MLGSSEPWLNPSYLRPSSPSLEVEYGAENDPGLEVSGSELGPHLFLLLTLPQEYV